MFDPDPVEGRRQISATIEQLARANFTLIQPWITTDYLVAEEGSTLYRNWHPWAVWGMLGVLAQVAARHGIKVHPWYSFTVLKEHDSADFDPRVGGDPNWAARHIDEPPHGASVSSTQSRPRTAVCPRHERARQWQQSLLMNVFARHPLLSGLHIEEPGYPYPGGYCVCQLCVEAFLSIHSADLRQSLQTNNAEDFRCTGTGAFMTETRTQLRRRFPKVEFSANGGTDWRRDRQLGRDWYQWAKEGLLSYYAAQAYSNSTDAFQQALSQTIKDLAPLCPVYAGIAFKWSGGAIPVGEVLRHVTAARNLGARGIDLFHGGALTPELYYALRTGPFSNRH
jgi:uncharacterized lipoprotein YddW (UPF0748 family)